MKRRVLLCAVALCALAACSLSEPVGPFFLPGDLVRLAMDWHRQHGRTTYNPSPGPTEAQLYRYAEQRRKSELILDTEDPERDFKLLARRCDAGDAAACDRVAEVFVYAFLDKPFGTDVWERSCQKGELRRCSALGDLYASNALPGGPSRELAWEHYLTACLAAQPLVRACSKAANVSPGVKRSARPDSYLDDLSYVQRCLPGDRGLCARDPDGAVSREYWACNDRACVLGDRIECLYLYRLFESREPSSAAGYYAALSGSSELVREALPAQELPAARQRIESELVKYQQPRCFTPVAAR